MMKSFNAIRAVIALLSVLLVLAACDSGVRRSTKPSPQLQQIPRERDPAQPTAHAQRMRLAIIKAAKAGSITQMAKLAEETPDFQSSPNGEPPRTYWTLLRRTGIDPTRVIRDIFEEPAGQKVIDGRVIYVWPDLAAMAAEDLIPEKLSFIDRRRLRELVGEEGIELIRGGSDYPGIQTAIDQDGQWLYFTITERQED